MHLSRLLSRLVDVPTTIVETGKGGERKREKEIEHLYTHSRTRRDTTYNGRERERMRGRVIEYGRKEAEEKMRVDTIEERRRMDDEKEKRRNGTRLNSARIQNERTIESGETERRRG